MIIGEDMIREKALSRNPAEILGKWLRQGEKPRLETNSYAKSSLCVTEIRYDLPDFGVSTISSGDAFAVGVSLRAHPFHEISADGRTVPVYDVRRGSSRFYDFSRNIVGNTRHPFHSLVLLLTRDFVRELANDLETSPVARLGKCPSLSVVDPHLERMASLVLPYLHGAGDMDLLKADHFMLYYGTYVCARYGGMTARRQARGGLNRWQERLAAEIIDAHLTGDISLATMANLCGLGTSQFSHAFKISFGVAPYRQLTLRRLDKAKELLCHGTAPLTEIAHACGFADQSHFTRAFRKTEGITPGAWRLAYGKILKRA